jgi:hypothetical protein
MTNKEFLQAVRDRVSTPETWSRRSYFRDSMGRPIWAEAEYHLATAWTIGGAAQAVTGYKSGATQRLATLLGFKDPVALHDWQDVQTHTRILKRLDDAIEMQS